MLIAVRCCSSCIILMEPLLNVSQWYRSENRLGAGERERETSFMQGCIQNFPDWPPGARSANGTALCHYVQLCRYFVSQSSEFSRHNSLCCFSISEYCCCFCCRRRRRLFHYRLSPETFRYTFVHSLPQYVFIAWC